MKQHTMTFITTLWYIIHQEQKRMVGAPNRWPRRSCNSTRVMGLLKYHSTSELIYKPRTGRCAAQLCKYRDGTLARER
ncbi:hypothetical protein J6590_032383 [Homalodisca vitripennis]|nr:hypothetical protein J6590_032383 [Homalodisca vitripennis]